MESRASAVSFISGIAFIIAGIAAGEGSVGIFVILPFVYGNGPLMIAGMLLIFISFPIFMLSQFRTTGRAYREEGYGIDGHYTEYKDTRTKKHAGGLILIGPIPIAISSDKNLAFIMMVTGMILALIFFLIFFFSL
jgi:uncharacterized protein (TIGR00304 family)